MYNHSKCYAASLGILILCAIAIMPACAGLIIGGGTRFSANVTPGATVQYPFTVSINENDTPTDVTVEVKGLGNALDGTMIDVAASKDTSPYSARTFISLDKTLIHLKSGEKETVTATMNIPTNVGAGIRYAMIRVQTGVQSGGGQVAVATAVNIPVSLIIQNTPIIDTGSISEISFTEGDAGSASFISTLFKNTGNERFVHVNDSVRIVDLGGKIVYTGTNERQYNVLVPDGVVKFDIPIRTELPVGTYSAFSTVSLNNTTLDEKSTVFEIKKKYVPPFASTSANLNPASQTVIASSDGVITITFPAGAVLDSTKITMDPVTVDDLPAAPSVAIPAVTRFSVGGLTGLLAKDATISIRYTEEDLAMASGDPTKFVLARYDKNERQWKFSRTTLDRGAGTLTVTTNRFSIWAVMVTTGQIPYEAITGGGGASETTKTEGFTAIIAGGALAFLVITWRMRKR